MLVCNQPNAVINLILPLQESISGFNAVDKAEFCEFDENNIT